MDQEPPRFPKKFVVYSGLNHSEVSGPFPFPSKLSRAAADLLIRFGLNNFPRSLSLGLLTDVPNPEAAFAAILQDGGLLADFDGPDYYGPEILHIHRSGTLGDLFMAVASKALSFPNSPLKLVSVLNNSSYSDTSLHAPYEVLVLPLQKK